MNNREEAADVSQVAVRMIHACGMVDLVRDLAFTPVRRGPRPRGAAGRCADLLRREDGRQRGDPTRLPAANDVLCTLVRPDACRSWPRGMGTTRSAAALELWRDRLEGSVVAVGNAPTALFRLLEMIEEGAPRPAAVIGVPVGLHRRRRVQGRPGREHASALDHLVVRGRRGGSAMAAAAVNAMASEEE